MCFVFSADEGEVREVPSEYFHCFGLGGGPVVKKPGDGSREWDAGLVESQPDSISGVLEAVFHGEDE